MSKLEPTIDIHCHILPGVDDGSPDMATSLEMLRIADKNGITHLILTPHHKPMHHNVSPQHNAAYRKKLQEAAKEAGIKAKLFSGNEIYYSDETMEELMEGKICSLAGSDYVLVEFHPTNPYKAIQNAVSRVQAAGFIPIIAHVERYSDIVSHPARVKDLIEMGSLIQVNASSIMGKYGFGISHFTKKLLKEELVHFVASDAHDTGRRAPNLLDCRNYVERKYGEDYGKKLFFTNPANVIRNELI
ncbi:CpsB/CapC family capsule biosynthesis tyrosine phosphatase [Butyrivibrio sp. FCS006]|uniref:CpsB/CapC family capsule biosynthesis tyrosine phosphatase n=1 Tax=Butyrivibrio sp. FCS006 TaxID=1280684 RepID=UPI00047BF23C|nr:CpsB/CapC family capsule biosynthesis tyrosine phosphatase [Butyrivibrio sp. FCS006]